MSRDSIGPAAMGRQIADEIAVVHQRSFGCGVDHLEVQLGSAFVAVMMDIELTPAEKTLIAAGHADAVVTSREAYQLAIEPTFVAIVERAIGRRVSAFASRTVIDGEGNWSAEVFKLGGDLVD